MNYDLVNDEGKNIINAMDYLSEEEKEEINENLEMLGNKIIELAVNRARKMAGEDGRMCGTYIDRMESLVIEKIRRRFTVIQLKYIVDNLSANDNKFRFELDDPENIIVCQMLNYRLNRLIPNLRIYKSRNNIDYSSPD